MKILTGLAVVVALGIGAILVSTNGCGAVGDRASVVGDKVRNHIDEMLGEMNVALKSVERKMAGLDEAIKKHRMAKITAEVKQERITEEVTVVDAKIKDCDNSLRKLRPFLESTENVSIAGNIYSPQDIRTTTQSLLKTRKLLVKQSESLKEAETSLGQTAKRCATKQVQLQSEYDELDTTLVEINAKKLALDTQREAALLLGGEDSDTISGEVASLKKEVNGLLDGINTRLRYEDEMASAIAAEESIRNTDSLLDSLVDVGAEVDAVLTTETETTSLDSEE